MLSKIWMMLALFFLSSLPAQAHKASDSYLSLQVENKQVTGQWDIALRDLEMAIGLDSDGNGEITWNEVRSHHEQIAAYALARLQLKNGAEKGEICPLNVQQHMLEQHTDGTYAVLFLRADCASDISQLQVDYRLLFDLDPQHKGLLKLVRGQTTSTAIFAPEKPTQNFTLANNSSLSQFVDYVTHGVWHIWMGFDHILFLLSLLLPAVLVFNRRQWQAASSLKAVALDVLKVVSAFTLAHSITLTLASLQILALPSRWVESIIAASVVLAALNNLRPLVLGRRWVVAFAFGLLHGFGFASVLLDLGLPSSSLAMALAGFNLGVEIGQLAIVAAFLPLAYWLRASWVYRRVVFAGGSGAIAMLAGVWLVQRVCDVKIDVPMLAWLLQA